MRNLSCAVAMLGVLLAGCATEAERITKDQLAVEQLRDEAAAKERAERTEKMEDYLDEVVPEWFLTPPKMDATGIYGAGTAASKDLGFAIRKAKLQAIYDASKVMKQEMSGQERSLQRDQGSEGDVAQRTELLIDALVAEVPVSGYDIVKNNVVPTDGQYHVFVLAKLPFDEFNQVLRNSKDGLKGEFDDAFNQLERRIKDKKSNEAPIQIQQPVTAPAGLQATSQAPVNAQANAEAALMKLLQTQQ